MYVYIYIILTKPIHIFCNNKNYKIINYVKLIAI